MAGDLRFFRSPVFLSCQVVWFSGLVARGYPSWHAESVSDYRDVVPGYRTIRVGPLASRAAQVADDQAWLAREPYPDLAFAGGAAFGVAHELELGGWELHRFYSCSYPQEARDGLGSDFRRLAAQHPEGSAAHAECMRAAERMDREVVDELTVLGTPYRIIRAEQFIRTGPLGPEPPRPTDPDPDEPGPSYERLDPAEGFVIDPVSATGMSEGILKTELLDIARQVGSVPEEVRDDLRRAAHTHPGGVLLPPGFTIGTLTRGKWGPVSTTVSVSPQAARDNLVGYLRVSLPARLDLSEEKRAVYAAAADVIEQDRANEVTAAGRRFRVVRVERLVRIGPDGPEGPRPSDPDPEPPVMQLPPVPEDEEDRPVEYSEETKRFIRLFEEEEKRRAARRDELADPEADSSQ
jgi:hypothetical protein